MCVITVRRLGIYDLTFRTIRETTEECREGIKRNNTKQARSITKGFVAHTAMRANTNKKWYFDSACSKHMTCVSQFLTEIKYGGNEVVTFCDGTQGCVLGKVTLNVPEFQN